MGFEKLDTGAAAGKNSALPVSCLLRGSDHLKSIFLDDVMHHDFFLSLIDSKWSETCKKHKTADPSATGAADRRRRRRPIFSVEYVNTSYHTTFHQNISINVACVHKRVLVA